MCTVHCTISRVLDGSTSKGEKPAKEKAEIMSVYTERRRRGERDGDSGDLVWERASVAQSQIKLRNQSMKDEEAQRKPALVSPSCCPHSGLLAGDYRASNYLWVCQ